jgi:hypothetical protein
LLRQLQVRGYFKFHVDLGSEAQQFLVEVTPSDDPEVQAMAAEVAELLGLERGKPTYTLVADTERSMGGDLVMGGRSLLGVLFYLSQGIEAPDAHVGAGWLTDTRVRDGSAFDWEQLTGRLFRVRQSASRPGSHFTAVPYRDHWFYLDDTDLNSKTTFNLLTLLFSLQASGGQGESPLLTVSAGG